MAEAVEEFRVSSFEFRVSGFESGTKKTSNFHKEESMATFKKFEEIEAWKKARELTKRIYDLSRSGEFSRDFGLRDQDQSPLRGP